MGAKIACFITHLRQFGRLLILLGPFIRCSRIVSAIFALFHCFPSSHIPTSQDHQNLFKPCLRSIPLLNLGVSCHPSSLREMCAPLQYRLSASSGRPPEHRELPLCAPVSPCLVIAPLDYPVFPLLGTYKCLTIWGQAGSGLCGGRGNQSQHSRLQASTCHTISEFSLLSEIYCYFSHCLGVEWIVVLTNFYFPFSAALKDLFQ